MTVVGWLALLDRPAGPAKVGIGFILAAGSQILTASALSSMAQ